MSRRLMAQRGMSLVEVTIILLVLMLLTGVLAPSILDFVNDAKTVKVKEDCEAIGVTVARLVRDVGTCLKFAAGQPCDRVNRVDLLFSNGPDVTTSDLDLGASTAFTAPNGGTTHSATLNWSDDDTRGDAMEDQFVTNAPSYTTAGSVGAHNPLSGFLVPGPAFFLGWRGAYLSSPIGPDPYGRRYLVNSVFLSVGSDANAGTGQGQKSGGWDFDVFCISGGSDTRFETHFGGSNPFTGGVNRGGDDFIYVISGGTR